MACSFPGAPDVDAFWRLLLDNRCGLGRLTDTSPDVWKEQRIVPVRGLLTDACSFDPEFFGFSEQDALLLDPQVRQMLMQVHRALHDAGIASPSREGLAAALFSSLSRSSYRQYLSAEEVNVPFVEDYSSEDLAPLRISHKLNLTGMSLRVQSTCSSGLLGIHLACQALRLGECDIAIVAGVSISFPQLEGYPWIDGGIHSITGQCRPFDALADGTVGGDGCAALVLKRSADASIDGSRVYATIVGSAVNNDGADRLGFTAPSVDGQVKVVKAALKSACVLASDVGMVEAHGTATSLGDPIEFAALTEAYGGGARPSSMCLTGVKGNIGHTDVVAGLAGVIKAALAVRNGIWLPIHGYQSPGDAINLEDSPFFVLTRPEVWQSENRCRVAGVSSLGMGGTNVHILLKQAVEDSLKTPFPYVDRPVLVPIAARTHEALEELCDEVHRRVSTQDFSLDLIAQAAAKLYSSERVRFGVVASSKLEFLKRLAARDTSAVISVASDSSSNGLVYVFPGLEELSPAHVIELASFTPIFQSALNRFQDWFWIQQGISLFPELFGGEAIDTPFTSLLKSHARVYAFQIALFESCQSLELHPTALIGYSIGEIAASVCAGVIPESLANEFLTLRSKAVIDDGRVGWMVAVLCSIGELPRSLKSFIAGSVSADLCMLAGLSEDWESVRGQLQMHDLLYREVGGKHGLHNGGSLPALGDSVSVQAQPPKWPLFSAYLGRKIEDERPLASLNYWLRQCMKPILFEEAVDNLVLFLAPTGILQLGGAGNLMQIALGPRLRLSDADPVIGELSRRAHVLVDSEHSQQNGAVHSFLSTCAKLWEEGHELRWSALQPKLTGTLPTLPMQPLNLRTFSLETQVRSSRRSDSGGLKLVTAKHVNTINEPLQKVILDEFGQSFGERGRQLDADFFQLGGHSLLALQLLFRVETRSGVRIPVRELMLNSTPRALAAKFADATCMQLSVDTPIWSGPQAEAGASHQRVAQFIERVCISAHDRSMPFAEYLAMAVADVIADAKSEFNLRLYPHEIVSLRTVNELSTLLVQALRESALGNDIVPGNSFEALVGDRVAPCCEPSPLSGSLILSSARSGSTLLRVMLAGHDRLFCPPELHLMMYPDLQQRKAGLGGSHFANGLVRAFQELLQVPWAEALEYTEKMERDGLSTVDTYRRLVALSGDRLLIDKSPSYAEDARSLARIDKVFGTSYIIYLVRHPLAVIESYVRNRIGSMNARYGSTPLHVLGEEHWLSTNMNIREWLQRGNRPHFFLRYEDLVTNPEAEMRALSRALGLSFSERMLTPYEGKRMIDGVGDPGIHEHLNIEARCATQWKSQIGGLKLSVETRVLAAKLGYES